MKTAMFTGIFRNEPLEKAAEWAAKLGYDGVELRANSHLPPGSTKGDVLEVKRVLDQNGLKAPVIYSNIRGDYARAEKSDILTNMDLLKRYAEWANLLGVEMICHSPGGPSPGMATEEHVDRAAEWMAQVAELLAAEQLRLVMEIHHGGLVETIASSMKLLGRMGQGNVGLVFDPGNMAIAGEEYGPEAVRQLGRSIFHVHTKDVKFYAEKPVDRKTGFSHGKHFAVVLMGQGDVDHRPAYEALRENGYNGFVSFECQTEGVLPEDIARHEYNAFMND